MMLRKISIALGTAIASGGRIRRRHRVGRQFSVSAAAQATTMVAASSTAPLPRTRTSPAQRLVPPTLPCVDRLTKAAAVECAVAWRWPH